LRLAPGSPGPQPTSASAPDVPAPAWPIDLYLCYVDESGDPGRQGSTHLILTGAALAESKWEFVRLELDRILIEYWGDLRRPPELHASDLRRGVGIFRDLTEAQRLEVERRWCAVVAGLHETELTVFTVISDKRSWFHQHPTRTGDELYLELFEDLSSRFDLFLRRRNALGAPSKGIIIADPHKKDLSKALRRQQRSALASGNRWSRIHNLIETVFFLDSQESPGLQVADLCCYAVWRLIGSGDASLAWPIRACFDRESPHASRNPGKWHGVKYLGSDPLVRARLASVWS